MSADASGGALMSYDSEASLMSFDGRFEAPPSSEETRLIEKTRGEVGAESRSTMWSFSGILAAGATLVAVVIVAAVAVRMGGGAGLSDTLADNDDGEFSFTLRSLDYSEPLPYFSGSSTLSYALLSGFSGVIEPHKNTTLHIVSGSSLYSSFTLKACPHSPTTVCSCQTIEVSTADTTTSTAASFSMPCVPDEDFQLQLTAYYSNGSSTTLPSAKAKCLYVRREIRQLSDADLTAMLDAMFTLYSSTDEAGMQAYGSSFLSSSYLTKMHHYNSALQDADHIHEGNGFMPQHIKMTNMFENSMQAVDPSVALAYWDFTIEQADGMAIYEAFPYTENVFGSMTLPADATLGFTYANDSVSSGAIPDGRWAFLKAETNTDYPTLKYGYGYLRAPWNLNPSPYVSRFVSSRDAKDLPSCREHYALLQTTSLTDFSYDASFAPHAGPHSLSGGVYGCDRLQPMLDQGYIDGGLDGLYSLCNKWLFLMKEFWRSNNFVPRGLEGDCPTPSQTQVDNLNFSCGFTCDYGNNTDNLLSNMMQKMSAYVPDDMQGNSTHPGWMAWTDFVCTGDAGMIFSGENLESAAPADPSFWVIHPTLERVYHAKLLAGGFESDVWPSNPEKEDVCDKWQCYQTGSVEGGSSSSSLVYDYYTECCDGHYEQSQLLDVSGDRCSYFGQQNGDTLTATDSSSATDYSMSYIYSSLDWDHCTAAGWDFTALFQEMSQAADTGTNRPTPSPTKKPTAKPSYASNTHAPTNAPNQTPKPTSTDGPTPSPTRRPTLSPVAISSVCDA